MTDDSRYTIGMIKDTEREKKAMNTSEETGHNANTMQLKNISKEGD